MNYWRYAGVAVGLWIGLPVLVMLLNRVAGINLSTPFLTVVPVMAAAMIEGQKFVTRHMRMPTRGETIRFVLLSTLTVAAIQAIFVAALITLTGYYAGGLGTLPSVGVVAVSLIVVVSVVALCNLTFLRISARGQMKRVNPQEIFK